MLILDGDKLAQDGYSGQPVDYFQQRTEMEDRIYSKNDTIENASKYIKEIHIFLNQNNSNEKFYPGLVNKMRKSCIYAKKFKIPFWLYNDNVSFGMLNKAKTVEINVFEQNYKKNVIPFPDAETFEPRSGWSSSNKEFDVWTEYLKKPLNVPLSDRARSMLYYIIQPFYATEKIRSLEMSIHNSRTSHREPLGKFLKIMQELNLKSPADVIAYIQKKYEDYYK